VLRVRAEVKDGEEECFAVPPIAQKKAQRKGHPNDVAKRNLKRQKQILRLTTPRLKKTPGAPFAQDDSIG
jgi:hypothetical protein